MRILFHYTHKQTLGHTTRSISFAQALCDRGAEVLILQGGIPQSYVKFPQGCQVVDIPHAFDSRDSFQNLVKPISAQKRAHFILKTTADFQPDVFITEFFPFGRSAYIPELFPTLRYLSKKNVRIIASIGYPLIADLERFKEKHFSVLKQALLDLFDAFLIHTPPELETTYFKKLIQPPDLADLYVSLMEKLQKRIVYTGYIFPNKIMTAAAPVPKMDLSNAIIISRGGGSVYPEIVTSAIEAQRYLDKKFFSIIACGPATSPDEMALFQSKLDCQDKERFFLADHINNLHDYLKSCRVSISLCGYNTSVQLMRYGTPSVVIPYQSPSPRISINEQAIRAHLLQDKFSSTVVNLHALNERSLAEAIQTQMVRPRPDPAPADWFNGAEISARIIMQGTSN